MTTQHTLEKVKYALLAMQRHSWEQGIAAQAFLELGETEPVILMAKEAVSRQLKDGRLGVIGNNAAVTDPAANGEAVLRAAELNGDPSLHEATEKMLNYLLREAPRTKEGILYHITPKPEVWVDSMYMAPPFLAVAGHVDEATRQIEGFRKLLWNPEKQLFSHIWDDVHKYFVRKDYWGTGNGWAATGMTRVLTAIPRQLSEERSRIAKYIREVIDGCLAYHREDGLFHDVVDDPEAFVETNLAQMLAYTIYRGIQHGWLEKTYLQDADRMRSAAHEKVDSYGLVQGVCGAPDFAHPGTSPEGQAFFLLMEAAARDCRSWTT